MLFNSYEFIFLFLPATLLGYHLLGRLRLTVAARGFLVLASVFFYARWNIAYLPLLLGSILANFGVARALLRIEIGRPGRKSMLIGGLVFNIGLLGYFKYADFFVGNLNQVAGTEFNLLHIVLPLGISFFTLQQIAYLVDVYEGLVSEQNLVNYALFVSFFPQLIAGPIVHHKEMMPQFGRLRNHVFSYRNASVGLTVFAIGLFKKVVIADTFAIWAGAGFDDAESLHMVAAWFASLSYTLQLYFDFSGYTDMAIGAAQLFNIRLPANFRSPYKATNIVDYWNRWHITLTNFITTYVYTPIVRAFGRITFGRSMVAIFLAMFISGLWHGASWTFVVWGLMHGAAIVVTHNWRRARLRMPKTLAWLLTFGFINLALVLFRARDWGDAIKVLRGMAGFEGVAPGVDWSGVSATLAAALSPIGGGADTVLMVALFLAVALSLRNSLEIRDSFSPSRLNLVGVVALLTLAVYRMGLKSEFLYFQF